MSNLVERGNKKLFYLLKTITKMIEKELEEFFFFLVNEKELEE